MTKFSIAQQMKAYAGLNCDISAAVGKPAGAPRPENAHLSCAKLNALLGKLQVTPFATGLAKSIEASKLKN